VCGQKRAVRDKDRTCTYTAGYGQYRPEAETYPTGFVNQVLIKISRLRTMNTTGAGIFDHVTLLTIFTVFTIPSHKQVMNIWY
jgi:hypothetical protein